MTERDTFSSEPFPMIDFAVRVLRWLASRPPGARATSSEIAGELGVTDPSVVRQACAAWKVGGTKGSGYDLDTLRDTLSRGLLPDGPVRVSSDGLGAFETLLRRFVPSVFVAWSNAEDAEAHLVGQDAWDTLPAFLPVFALGVERSDARGSVTLADAVRLTQVTRVMTRGVPEPTAWRMRRLLDALNEATLPILSSTDVAALIDVPSHTLRKDLSLLELEAGVQGIGLYRTRLVEGLRATFGFANAAAEHVVVVPNSDLGRAWASEPPRAAFPLDARVRVAFHDENVPLRADGSLTVVSTDDVTLPFADDAVRLAFGPNTAWTDLAFDVTNAFLHFLVRVPRRASDTPASLPSPVRPSHMDLPLGDVAMDVPPSSPHLEVPPVTEPTVSPKAAAYLDFLSEEGFRPQLDQDGDVSFKFEGGHYVLFTRDPDPRFFHLLYPFFFEHDPDEDGPRVLATAMHVTKDVKVAKVYPAGGNDVSASVELFLPNADDFKAVLSQSLSALQYAVRQFRAAMQAN
ncbi:winged-helix domain-containing protein [Deinococcus yavapaiensis]|uniref:Uncharacterized protein n=1 Tax=Deinococcus yavapaiensis KR-236 TaxID=694435 RepID=A0A318S3L2_9DEIO|nr:winged-helix domain-containing protein [Deinococcus yavapaiensis]PYE52025.1 hypothetical protein DES52_11371 [Deinococcus yavapaiensis KR-236]